MGGRWERRRETGFLAGFLLLGMTLAAGCSEQAKKPRAASECAPGSIGCACTEEGTCGSDLSCEENQCVGAGSVGFAVDPRARGCEVLFEAAGAPVTGVEFSDDVRGAFVSEAPRTAVTFIAAEDAPIPDGAVRVRYQDEGRGAPELSTVRCTDHDGAPIPDAEVTSHG